MPQCTKRDFESCCTCGTVKATQTESTRSGSMEKRLGDHHPPPSTNINAKMETQGSLPGPSGGGSSCPKPHLFALGNCLSTRVAQTLWIPTPHKCNTIAQLHSRSILDICIYSSPHFSSLSLPSPQLVTLVTGFSKQTYLFHSLGTCSTPPSLHSFLSLSALSLSLSA